MEEENFSDKKFYQRRKFWITLIAGFILVLVLVTNTGFSSGSSFLSNFAGSFRKTLSDVFGIKRAEPVYEFSLSNEGGRSSVLKNEVESEEKISELFPGVAGNKEKSLASVKEVAVQNIGFQEKNPQSEGEKRNSSTRSQQTIPDSDQPIKDQTSNSVHDCDFSLSGDLNRKVFFNEIAWMGGKVSASDEWMELGGPIGFDLGGWQIKNEDESIKIIFSKGDKISAGGFFLLERTDDDSVPGVTADKIYVGALSNAGEWLKLFDSDCKLVDEVNAHYGWEPWGGDNNSKKTLERNLNFHAWQTSENVGGTPKAKNSENGTPPNAGGIAQTQPSGTGSTEGNLGEASTTPPNSSSSVSLETKILISEVMAGSSASADYEFIEIYNYGSEAVDLTGWYIKKKSSSGAESSLVAASRLSGKSVSAGKHFLLAHDGGYTGTVAADVLWPASYSLAYTNNTITIYNVSGAVIDAVSWTEIPKDKAYARSSLDISAGFAVTDAPGPQNSQ